MQRAAGRRLRKLTSPGLSRSIYNAELRGAAMRDETSSVEWLAEATGNNGVSVDDFYAYMPMHSYIYAPSREMWPASSVNARVPPIPGPDNKSVAASTWIDQSRPVEQMTWCPGLPMLMRDRLISEGGWIEHSGVSCFNFIARRCWSQAAPPRSPLGLITCSASLATTPITSSSGWRIGCSGRREDQSRAGARRQPGDRQGHALEPVKQAVGPWNFQEVSPQHVLGRFNGFLKSVVLRLNEARDLGDFDRFKFYDHMKAFTAAPPDVLRVDEKHLREHYVFNCTGVIITTNHKADGIYLPADDRRHFVAWSTLSKDDFDQAYWQSLWCWYRDGGIANVAAYLASLILSTFDPKAPPPKTPAFWDIVDASRAPKTPSLPMCSTARHAGRHNTDPDRQPGDRRLRGVDQGPQKPPRDPAPPGEVRLCPGPQRCSTDGFWRINGRRQVVYARSALRWQRS